MKKTQLKKIYEEKGLNETCQALEEEGYTITSYETIRSRIIEEAENDNWRMVIHLAEALKEAEANYYNYDHSMGTLEDPTPITDIQDLIDLL